MNNHELYIGIMSGTSLDAIDACLVDFSNQQIKIVSTLSLPLDKPQTIAALNHEGNIPELLELDQELAYDFANACHQLLKQAGVDAQQVKAIGCHGQTIRHNPQGQYGYSRQIGNGARIAQLTNICTVNDFRSRDVAAGGQGAPLVPAFHEAAFAAAHNNMAVINIGGMANITTLKNGKVTAGFDTGPGNVLMNAWVKEHKNQNFDEAGSWAQSGNIDQRLLNEMLDHPYFKQAAPKSTGRETFDRHWLDSFMLPSNSADTQATLLELTAQSIYQSLPTDIEHIYVCGGGAHNTALVQRLDELTAQSVLSTEHLGINPDWVEAAAFAWLAKQALSGKPSNCPIATGASSACVLGAIYPA